MISLRNEWDIKLLRKLLKQAFQFRRISVTSVLLISGKNLLWISYKVLNKVLDLCLSFKTRLDSFRFIEKWKRYWGFTKTAQTADFGVENGSCVTKIQFLSLMNCDFSLDFFIEYLTTWRWFVMISRIVIYLLGQGDSSWSFGHFVSRYRYVTVR